jgi:hypothetical protein
LEDLEPMAGERKAIIVAGMHRSGTSAVTRVINLLGADLAFDLVPEGIGNERGHWESRAVQDLHNRLLAALCSEIYSPVDFAQSWFDGTAAQEWIDRIESLMREEYPASGLFVLKDPRIVLFVPLWIAALNRLAIEPHFVIPFRHPVAVAASLQVRERRLDGDNPLPLSHGVATWLRYALAAERHTRGQKRAFVSFERLLTGWRGELTRIGRQLDIRWPRFETAEAQVDRFLDSSHRDPTPLAPADERVHVSRSVLLVHDGFSHAVGDPRPTPAAFEAAAAAAAAAEDILGAYVLIKETQAAELRAEIKATLSRHANEDADAHRAFESEIRARDSRIAESALYARSLEQSRDEALHYARAQEMRANELDLSLETARQYARSLEQSRDEALRHATAQEVRANELDLSLETARQYALSLEQSRDEALRYAEAAALRGAGVDQPREVARENATGATAEGEEPRGRLRRTTEPSSS